ncbi:unnamed protein product [Anisakis simplex]|uniref:26S proteasome non-ATPase regulatory subunit 2 (inferred by orthology to a human protein) n=1 Tax=Anisakis simplex TaxID=6269 RepID=A0A0M3K3R6_ANISI|nr:unnamed protein product [Anisakis simplex]
MQIRDEWRLCSSPSLASRDSDKRKDDLLKLVREIVGHNMKYNAEIEACDLLIEIERLDVLSEFVHCDDHARVCLYLISCSPLSPDPDNRTLIKTALDIYMKFGKNLEALRCGIWSIGEITALESQWKSLEIRGAKVKLKPVDRRRPVESVSMVFVENTGKQWTVVMKNIGIAGTGGSGKQWTIQSHKFQIRSSEAEAKQ